MKGIYELTGAKILHSYGSTEAMAITTLNMSKPWLEKDFSDVERWELKKKQGAISVGIDVKIVDDEGMIYLLMENHPVKFYFGDHG